MAEHQLPERDQFPNNSRTAREDRTERRRPDRASQDARPKVEKVTKGTVIQKKPPLGRRLAQAFGAREGQGIFDYILCDIIIPATKNMIIDSISDGVAMAFGEAPRRRRRSRSDRGGSRFDYDRVSYRDDDRRGDRYSDRRRTTESSSVRDYENLSFASKDDADEVISALVDIIDRCEYATVLDLYEAAGVQAPDYAVGNYGWYKLGSAYPRRIRDGYVLDLPKPVLL